MFCVKRLYNLLGKASAFPRSWFWLFLLVQAFQATAQPDTLWIRNYPGFEAYDVISDEEGNLFIAGVNHPDYCTDDMYAMKLNSDREVEWLTPLVDEWDSGATTVCISDNSIYICGRGGHSFERSGLIAQISLAGDSTWYGRFGGRSATMTGMVSDGFNGVYTVGITFEYAEHGSSDGILINLDSDGNERWRRVYGGPSTNYFYSIIRASDRSLMMVGQTTSYGGGAQAYLVKADTTGEVIWFGAYGDSSGADLALEVAQAPNGDYLLAGYTNWSMGGSADMLVIRVSSDGEEIWRRNYGTARWGEELCDLVVLPGGDIVVVGEGGCPPADVILMRLNPDGDVVWETYYNIASIGYCNGIILSENGGYYFVGRRSNGYPSAYLACTEPDPANNAVTLLDPAFPSGFGMVSPYPNPFNAVVRFSYSLPIASKVDLGVYDLNGRLIQRLINGQQEAGEYRALWNGDGSPAGLYFLHLKAGSTVQTKRMVLVK